VGAELGAPLLAEELPQQEVERPLQVGERDPLVDGEAFDLVEDRRVRGIRGVAPVDAAEGGDVDGRLLRLHRADLGRGRLRAQHRLVVEEQRRERRAGRVPGRERERVEVVVGGLDLATVDDAVAEPEEDVLDLPPDLRDQVQAPALVAGGGQGDVDPLPVRRASSSAAASCSRSITSSSRSRTR
jgi:hypothetical protein